MVSQSVSEGGTEGRIQTTIRLPKGIYQDAKSLIDEPGVEIATFNDLVVESLQWFIRAVRREQVDRAFSTMHFDSEYQCAASEIESRFAESERDEKR